MNSLSDDVLQRVANRLRLASFGQRFYLFVLIGSGVYACVLLVARLTGVPEGLVFAPLSLLAIPASALLLSTVFHRRPTAADAARAVDKSSGSKDLFLTYSMLDRCPGDYKPLVKEDAEQLAQGVEPATVVSLNWGPRLGSAFALGIALLLGVIYLPQFDPFGKVAAAEEARQEQDQLKKDKLATVLRTAALKEQGEISKDAEAVDEAIKELTKSFGQMKRNQQEQNRAKLAGHQKEIGAKWRELGSEKLRTLLSQNNLFQDFGGKRQQKLRKWSDELMEGSSDELNRELQQLQKQLEAMLSEKDPVKRSEMAKDLKEQLRDLEEFASENVGSPELSAALRRAMRQMEQVAEGKDPREMAEAMEALAESLDLTKMELRQIADAARSMKTLEEALETLQKAKQLNEQNELDSEGTSEFQTLSDYAELYAELMGEDQDGSGTGGEGFGEGGEVPEDDSEETEFKREQEKIATRAGKILLSIKGKGMGEAGEANKQYRQLIGEVKQGVSEAIVQEQIPPGYHEGIRGYFDSIDDKSQDRGP